MESVWLPSPAEATISRAEVHVWRASLDSPQRDSERWWAVLSGDEKDRAQRFHFERDRKRYVASRGLLRIILSRYLRADAAALRFEYNDYGKPAIAGGSEPLAISFNLSHSHELALYAVTSGRRIGIDVEFMRSDLADEQIAERFFAPQEVREIRSLSPEHRAEAFFNCWTRKEAFIKARGEGLSLPLHKFQVSLAPGAPAVLVHTADDPEETLRWRLQALAPGSGYAGAVAVEGHEWELRCWQICADQ